MYFKIMTNTIDRCQLFKLILIFLVSLFVIARPKTALAQPNVRFFCGTTEEIDQKPATVIASRGYHRTIIVWEYPMGNMTAQERCDRITPLFQKAWEERRFNLRSGTDRKTGQGIICAVRKGDTTCERKNQLFVLRSGADAQKTIGQLFDAIHTAGLSSPIHQSSSIGSIDLQELIDTLGK
jgi:Circadian oscillating protein COP23